MFIYKDFKCTDLSATEVAICSYIGDYDFSADIVIPDAINDLYFLKKLIPLEVKLFKDVLV